MNGSFWILDFVNAPMFVLELGQGGIPRYVAVNKAVETLLDKAADQVVGQSAADIFTGQVAQTVLDNQRRVFSNAQPVTYEVSFRDGATPRIFQATVIPQLDQHGQVIRAFGTVKDVSGDLMASAMQSDAKAFQCEMEDFINLAAHDLRAPVMNVSSIAALLREDFQDLGDGKLELIDMLETIGSKALELISDVLACANMSQTGAYQVSTFHLDELMHELMTVLDPMETCVVDCTPVTLECDRIALQLVLRNLIENALKYSKKNDEPLHISLSVRECATNQIEVTLQDNGPGFDDASLLFLSDGTIRSGSGFGLLGVRRLLRARGGSIAAANLPNCSGAEVRFTLPGSTNAKDCILAAAG